MIDGDVEHIRFWRNKTVKNRNSHYSKWHALGPFLKDSADFPYMSAACPRALLNKYLQLTEDLPRADDLVFISAKKQRTATGPLRRHHGICSDTVASDVGKVMTWCGVPARYKPHSTRHSKLSTDHAVASAGGLSLDDALAKVDVSKEVFKLFYSQPFSKDRLKPDQVASLKGSRKAGTSIGFELLRAAPQPPAPPAPPLVLEDGEVEYSVASIVDKRHERGVDFYKVRWQGFGSDDDTWEPSEQCDCDDAIRAFNARQEAAQALQQRRLARMPPTRQPPATGKATTSSSRVLGRVLSEASWAASLEGLGARKRSKPGFFKAAHSIPGDGDHHRPASGDFGTKSANKPRNVTDLRRYNKDFPPNPSTLSSELAAKATKITREMASSPPAAARRSGRKKKARSRAKTASGGSATPSTASRTDSGVGTRPRSSRVRTGSNFVTCTACGEGILMAWYNHHLESECVGSATDPSVVD
jgi:hypothetical protein